MIRMSRKIKELLNLTNFGQIKFLAGMEILKIVLFHIWQQYI